MSIVKIDPYVSQIRDAVYGEEVRDAIINALLVMNDNITYEGNSGSGLPISVKILGIGNSYTRDPFRWLWKILKEAGISFVTVGHGYKGGNEGSLANQWASIISQDSATQHMFEYWKYDNSQNPSKTSGKSLQDIITDEDWDIVVFQNQSDQSGFYNNWASLYTKDQDHGGMDFIDWVDSFLVNADRNRKPKIGIFCPWTHHPLYGGSIFVNTWHSDPEEQEAAYRDVIPHVANSMSRCDFVVNGLDAINFARENSYLNAIGERLLKRYKTSADPTDLESDYNHLEFGIPQFLMGFCYAATLFGIKPSDITWYPTLEEITTDVVRPDTTYVSTAYLAYLAKVCAYNASKTLV